MTTRVGIELSPVACRIVELRPGAARGAQQESRVTAFAALAWSDPSIRERLAALRGRDVAVVAWGLRSWHQRVDVADGRYDAMRAEAAAALAGASAFAPTRLVDLAPAGPSADGALLRPVLAAAVDASGVRAVLAPLVDARVRARSLVTPAVALMSLARLRRAMAAPGATEAYVALEETATAVALVRDGVLLAARELEWGFLDPARPPPAARPRQEIGARLAGDLRAFFADAMAGPVSLVCICGALADLRSTTVPLIERLDVEVETLDSLFGIDIAALPEPAAEFRVRAAGLRMAWAVAADAGAPINLLRDAGRRARRAALARTAVAAGVVAGLGAGWQVARQPDWLMPRGAAAIGAPPASRPVATPQSAARAPVRLEARVEPPVVSEPVRSPARVDRAVASAPARSQARVERPVLRARQRSPVRIEPFDAVLGTILFGPDRRLAVIDGRIVQVGDEVRGAEVVDIRPNLVLLRDVQGRLRQLVLGFEPVGAAR